MRLHSGTTRSEIHPGRPVRRLERTAILPGRTPAWRPPIRLIGLLELIRRTTPAVA